MITEKFHRLFTFAPKSQIKAGDGTNDGSFPLYTSSAVLSKKIDRALYYEPSIIFGTGGRASVHYCEEPFSTSTDCLVAIKYSDKINPKFAFYYLASNIRILEQGFKGAGLQHISKKYIENIDLPIINLESQNKIVTVLDKLSAIVEKRAASIALAEKLLSSTFLEWSESYLVGWEENYSCLGNIAEIVSGLTKGRKTTKRDFVEVPYLRVANVQDGFFDLSEIKYIDATQKEVEQYSVKKLDIFLTEGGDPDKLGRGAIWEEENTTFIYQNHLFRVRTKQNDDISPYWLLQLIGSSFGKNYFLKQAKQTTGIATINSRQVKGFPVPYVPIDIQRRFERAYHLIKKRILLYKRALNLSRELFNCVAQYAFREQLNFNIDVELDSLIKDIDLFKSSNDLTKISNDEVYLQRLIDKLNEQEFDDKDLYDKAKHGAFQLLKENQKVTQVFNKKNKSVKLALK